MDTMHDIAMRLAVRYHKRSSFEDIYQAAHLGMLEKGEPSFAYAKKAVMAALDTLRPTYVPRNLYYSWSSEQRADYWKGFRGKDAADIGDSSEEFDDLFDWIFRQLSPKQAEFLRAWFARECKMCEVIPTKTPSENGHIFQSIVTKLKRRAKLAKLVK